MRESMRCWQPLDYQAWLTNILSHSLRRGKEEKYWGALGALSEEVQERCREESVKGAYQWGRPEGDNHLGLSQVIADAPFTEE